MLMHPIRSSILAVLITVLGNGDELGGTTSVQISSYLDDPFVSESVIKRMDSTKFGQHKDGRPTLRSNRVWIQDEDVIYRQDKTTKEYKKFAWNPWPETWKNPRWDLTFPEERRFPLFTPERDADNKIILRDGLQVWAPQDLNLGNATVYEAANSVKDAADLWSGRDVDWGIEGGLLLISTHAFIEFNGFYSPTARQVFLGIVPYRLPGETEVKIAETATCWELVAHESGHAIHAGLKPNMDPGDIGVRAWAESFGDQTAMWTSLRNPERVSRLLTETKGDLNQSNSITRVSEAWAVLLGQGTGVRDAFHDQKVSDTSEEEHDRSEVFTGAAYRIFLAIFEELRRKHSDENALREAGRIMGLFLTRATDYTPENRVTLEDVSRAYLKVDKELFGGRYHQVLVDEFIRRELLDANSVRDWLAHERALPPLWLPSWLSDTSIAKSIEADQGQLGIGPDFGLKVQSVTRLNGGSGETVVRVQLTQGAGVDGTLLNNHGILVFRSNGDLAEYHSPLPRANAVAPASEMFEQAQAMTMIGKARQTRLGHHDAPLSLVRKADGSLSVELRVLRGEGLNAHMQVFTPENPGGERREILLSPLPVTKRLPIANELLQ